MWRAVADIIDKLLTKLLKTNYFGIFKNISEDASVNDIFEMQVPCLHCMSSMRKQIDLCLWWQVILG